MDKIANIRVSDRAGEWAKDILEHFYTMYPELMNVDARVLFKKKEPNKGYGIGGLDLGAVTVPVVIRNFHLAPLDVAVSQEGNILPFNRHVVVALTNDTSAFKSAPLLKDSQSFKLLFGRNALSQREDMIDASKGVEKTASAKKYIQDNWSSEYNVTNLIEDWFNKQAGIVEADEDGVRDKLPRDVCLLVKNASADHSYSGYFGSSHLHDVVEERVNAEQLPEELRDRKIIVKTAANDEITKYAETGDFTLITTSDMRTLGIDGDGNYKEFPYIGHNVNKEEEEALVEKLAAAPGSGDYGMWYVNGHFTEPMTILNIETSTEPEMMKIATFGGTYKKNYQVIRPIKDIVEGEKRGEYYLPTSASWVKLANSSDELDKSYMGVATPKIVKLAENSYTWKGQELNKYAETRLNDSGPYTSKDTMLALLNMGASENDILKIAELKVGEVANVNSKLELKPTIEEFIKEAELADKEFKPIFKMGELVKIAAPIKDKNTVDAVLGLGYLNANVNEEEYFEYIPQLEDVAQRLSKMLLDSQRN